MQTGSGFDLTSIMWAIAGILVGIVGIIGIVRLFRVYLGAGMSDVAQTTGDMKVEDKGKKYLQVLIDAAVVIVLILGFRTLLGFFIGLFQGGLGDFV